MADEVKMYSARPFVGLAGPDNEGFRQEVLVKKGVGQVVGIENRGKTAQVEIQIPGLEYTIKGWINTDTDAFRIAEEQYENGNAPIQWRLEQQRKAKNDKGDPIPKETPIYELLGKDENGHGGRMDLAKNNSRKLLVGVGKPDGEMFFSQELTDPAEDPQYGAGRPSSARVNKTASAPTTPASTSGPAGPSNSVEIAHTAINPDGYVNPGSYSVQAPIDIYFWLKGKEADNTTPELGEKRTQILSSALIAAASEIQKDLYEGESEAVDREVSSFKLIIDTMKKVVDSSIPLTNDDIASHQTVQAWVNEVANQTESIIKWGLNNASTALGVEFRFDD